ncbi:phosphatidylinositol-4-phosphate-5-kinase [Nosema bombycis CQ1]|uniref:Phosphatidylinositol-4-phosphate-5-kinase n=1 Tax=Nosema bombycis (strain CQ1 / CVCC 102059) TaxID=578461 RepID=R0KV67_NOSB1|nr:phosphatidylinositol-4-phosphate-5-kinase [Nosema bombycis CQ1]|eukprot:EOB14771.1 phosphatidylinositol-4-phosphate-5-kinase [Nosema bombycis CQ1]
MALARGTNNYIKKDMDWYEDNRKLVISNSELDQIHKDMIFLENQNIMDYSLMVYYPGRRKDSHFELFNMKNKKTYTVSKDLRSSDKPFFIGIVDILTDYDCKKKVEYLWNTFCICKNKSCLNPKIIERDYLI